MRIVLLWLILGLSIAGCAAPLPPPVPAPTSPPEANLPRPDDLRKVGPELRQHLLQRGRQLLEAPETLSEQLRPVTVVIQAHRDISDELEKRGGHVRSVTQNETVIITAEVPPAAIPGLLRLPDLETIDLAQPVPPAQKNQDSKMQDKPRRMEDGG